MLIVLLASASFAMSNFPGDIADDLGMPCTPTCDLCHSSASGGGTPTTAFGMAMMDRGMTSSSSSLAGALDQMVADAVDSDDDGIIDTEELAQGMNPNGDADYCVNGQVGPSYGCASPGARPLGLAALSLGLLGLALRRRR